MVARGQSLAFAKYRQSVRFENQRQPAKRYFQLGWNAQEERQRIVKRCRSSAKDGQHQKQPNHNWLIARTSPRFRGSELDLKRVLTELPLFEFEGKANSDRIDAWKLTKRQLCAHLSLQTKRHLRLFPDFRSEVRPTKTVQRPFWWSIFLVQGCEEDQIWCSVKVGSD